MSRRRQQRMDALQNGVIAAAVFLLGVAVAFGDVASWLPRSPVLGGLAMVIGALMAARAVVAFRRSARPRP